MHYLPPRPWAQIVPGTVVMSFAGVACTVLANDEHPRLVGLRVLLLEGVAEPLIVRDYMHACPVELDDADAIGNLHTTGLHPTPAPTEGNPS